MQDIVRKTSILVVGKAPFKTTGMAVVLESGDLQVIIENDLDRFPEKVDANRPDAIILDLDSFEESGSTEVLEQLASVQKVSSPPVLLISSETSATDTPKLDNEGVQRRLKSGNPLKLKHPQDLIKEIDILLQKRRTAVDGEN